MKNENSAFYEASMTVTQHRRPVANALVKLVPEAAMGSAVEPAEGQTDETGLTFFNVVGGKTFGVRGGLYRVHITGMLPDGSPIPGQYNSDTTLGIAVGGGLPQPRTPEFKLD